MAVDYVRVVCGKVSVSIDLDRKTRTFSDIAEAAAIKHLGKSAAAEVPAVALSLRGPVAYTDDLTDAVLAALREMDTVSLGRVIDPARATGGAWFLLEIDSARGVGSKLESGRVLEGLDFVLDHFLSTSLPAALGEPREGGGAAVAAAAQSAPKSGEAPDTDDFSFSASDPPRFCLSRVRSREETAPRNHLRRVREVLACPA